MIRSPTQDHGAERLLGTSAFLFLFALSVRLLFLLDVSEAPTFRVPVVDSFVYHQAAVSLTRGEGFQSTFFFQPFFYPFFLSAVFAVSGASVVFAKIVQATIGALTCVLVGRLAGRSLGRTTGLVAGIVVALYGPLIFYETELLAAGLAAFESVALVLLLLSARSSRSPWLFVSFGLFGAICVLTRPTFLPVILAGTAWLGFGFRQSSVSARTVAPLLGFAVLGFLIPISAVAVLDRAQTGHLGFLPSSGGINFYLGNNESYEETVNARMGSEWSDLLHLPGLEEVPDDDRSRSRFYWERSMEYAASRPGDFAAGMGRKTLQLVSSRETPRNVDVYLFREWSWMLRGLLWKAGGFGFPFGLLFPFAVVGCYLARRRIPFVLLLSIVAFGLSVAAVFVTARYRIPLVPLLAVPAAAGMVGVARTIRERRMKRFGAASLVLAGSVLVSTLPGPFVAERMDYEAELHCCIGDSLRRTGRMGEALEEFREAIRIDPGHAEAHADLAQLLAAQGAIPEAIVACRTALEIEPDMARALNNLGSLLSDVGEHEEAIEVCRRGLEARPKNSALHFNLAKALAGSGDVEAAREQLEKTVELDPENAPAFYELARMREREGRIEEAIALYTRAAESGRDPEIRAMLADHHVRAGRFEDARLWYSKALELAPEDPGLHHSLAMVLDRLDRIDEAARHLREAVRIDPGFTRAGYDLGSLLIRNSRFAEAVAPLEETVRSDPATPEPRHALAVALAGAGRGREAVDQYRRTLRLAPDFVPSLSGLAWLLATHPDPGLRDGTEALTLAERAAAIDGTDPNVLDTLAAAHAEIGSFGTAVETAKSAAVLAERMGRPGLARNIRERLGKYGREIAFRDLSFR